MKVSVIICTTIVYPAFINTNSKRIFFLRCCFA